MNKEILIDGMMGLVVGDACGVPVEFNSREELMKNPVVNMRGHGSHNQPKGTWSDDSSMALATLASLRKGYDLIPSSGRRGRCAASQNTTTIKNDSSSDKISALEEIISKKDTEISSLKSGIKVLKIAIKTYEKACGSISKILASLPDNL